MKKQLTFLFGVIALLGAVGLGQQPSTRLGFHGNPKYNPRVSPDKRTITFTTESGREITVDIKANAPSKPKTSRSSSAKLVAYNRANCSYDFTGEVCEWSDSAQCVLCTALYYSSGCEGIALCYNWPGCECGEGCTVFGECFYQLL